MKSREFHLIPLCARRGFSILAAAPFDSGILATGPVPGATYDYEGANPAVLDRVRRIVDVGRDFDVALPAAALQFPLRNSIVASVVAGMRTSEEVATNLGLLRRPIAGEFWHALEREGILRPDASIS